MDAGPMMPTEYYDSNGFQQQSELLRLNDSDSTAESDLDTPATFNVTM